MAWAFGAIIGAAVFFGWPHDLVWTLGLIPVGLGLVGAAFWREGGWFCVAVGLAFALAGLQVQRAGEEFNWAVAARKPHWVVGRVSEIVEQKDNPNRVTLTLHEVKFYQLKGTEGIKEVRAGVFRNQIKDVKVGDGVAVPILLVAPEGPKFKGDRDNRLWRYMDRGVVRGFARGTAEATYLPPARPSTFEKGSLALDDLRARITAGSGGKADGVVSALLVGDQRAVKPEVRAAYRATGLTHLIAISGMQLTLVGGGIFLLIRRIAARFPTVALRYNVKAIAALAGLLGAAFYTLLVGAQVSMVRSFVMLALVMLAALTGRLRSGLRAWSVAAVLGLLIWGLAEEMPKGVVGWSRGMVLSSIVAGAATAPLVVWNFSQLSAVSLLANLVAVPLMALATYVGMAGLVAWPTGAQGPVLDVMASVVGLVNKWALWLASWQGGVAVDAGWWPLVGLAAVVTLVGVVWRWWPVTLLGVVAMVGLAWGASRVEAPLQEAVLDGGKVGVVAREGGTSPTLIWAEDRKDAGYLLQEAGLGTAGEGTDIPEVADESLLPVSHFEHIAWAEKRGGAWEVAPLDCKRVWQRVDSVCHGDGYKEESIGE